MSATIGFPPICGSSPRVLILGSLPSRKSVELGQYYGHPQNAFWRIMGDMVDAGPDIPYKERAALLESRYIAVWDVLASSVRPGSMDAAIVGETANANDFSGFLGQHTEIRLVCFNGQAAEKYFRKLVSSNTRRDFVGIVFQTLPSTSPAYAAMPYSEKLKLWSATLAPIITE
ncbi:MAG: DNA-deoxyinosine glycosylase [Woeseiaceae bacterium]